MKEADAALQECTAAANSTQRAEWTKSKIKCDYSLNITFETNSQIT